MSRHDEIKQVAKREASASSDLRKLVARAALDPKLASELMVDLDGVIRREGLAVDGESEEYKNLSLRLHHAKTLLNRTLDDIGGPGLGIDFGDLGGARAGYESLVDPGDFDTPMLGQPPIDIPKLKSEILAELRKEIKGGEK